MKKSFVIVLHMGYWILYLLMMLLFVLFMQAGGNKGTSPDYDNLMRFLRLMSALTIIPGMISFYVFYQVLFKKFLSKKKIWALCTAGIITAVMAGFVGIISLGVISQGMMAVNNDAAEMSIILLFLSILALIHGIIALVMKGFITWYGDIKVKEELQHKNFETELALVKSQLSPHFLFNTINNIDVLIEKDAQLASAYLIKLSDIMRFMLYETKTEKITLLKELSYIDKYIELQKIRTANLNFVNYTFKGKPDRWMITPMLFIPFIENAFKHSGNKKTDQAITIRISATNDVLNFYCENNFAEITPQLHQEEGGLGINLIRKRLNLLYPGKHDLKINNENNVYKINLTINADEN